MNILMHIFVLAPLITIALLASPNVASAHGEAALTFTSTTTDGYIVDIDIIDGYLQADTFTRMNLGLFKDSARTESANFTDIWVRIVRKDGDKVEKVLFAGPIAKPRFGGIGFSFVFPEGGIYTLSVRYNDTSKDIFGETVAEVEFELDVLRSQKENNFTFGSEFWIGMLIGVFGCAILMLPFFVRRENIVSGGDAVSSGR